MDLKETRLMFLQETYDLMIFKLDKEDLIIIMLKSIKLNGTFINGKQLMILQLNTQPEHTEYLHHSILFTKNLKEFLLKKERPKSDNDQYLKLNKIVSLF
jgi:hypothetical protein